MREKFHVAAGSTSAYRKPLTIKETNWPLKVNLLSYHTTFTKISFLKCHDNFIVLFIRR